ncbi:MAG: CpsD/CapB family tyrosine-protein kinase [Clostridia bacterium]|nr:CpsD/CapB family tyrosine-protein kinase [Clostridia bacterium]
MARNKNAVSVTLSSDEHAVFGKNLGFAASEAYRLLRTNLMFSLPTDSEHRCRVIGLTSANAGEGKSTTALNLAYMLAEAHQQTILVEADMRLPTISKRLGLKQSPGLSNVLVGLTSKVIAQPSGIEDFLKVISSGDIPPNPSELLGSSKMKTLIDVLSKNADFIVIDLPPINEVADALVVSQFVDGMLMIVRQGYASRHAVIEAMKQLEHANAKVLGFVVTGSENFVKGKYKYKKYGKYGKYGRSHNYGYAQAVAEEKSGQVDIEL